MRRTHGGLRTPSARCYRSIVIGVLIAAAGVVAWALPGAAHRGYLASAGIVALAVLVVSVTAWLLRRPRRQPGPSGVQAPAVQDLNLRRQMADREYLVPRELPAAPAIFVGRETEIRDLRKKMVEAHQGARPFIAAVTGPGGIGKTALALSFAHRVYDSFPSGQLFFRVAAWDANTNGTVPGLPGTTADDAMARLAQGLVLALRGPNDPVPDVSERAELITLFQRTAAGRTLIIVLDDVPADVDLSPILKVSDTSAVIVTARRRPRGIGAESELPLRALGDDESMAMLEQAIGKQRVQRESGAARSLVAWCKGEPLALRLACAALAIRPHWKLSLVKNLVAGEARPFDAAYGMLTEDEQHALRCIGAIGRARIAPWALQATLGDPHDPEGKEAQAVASRLARTGLIERTNSGAGGVPAYEVSEPVAAYARGIANDAEKTQALDRLRAERDERDHKQPAKTIREEVYRRMREGQLQEAVDWARDALALTRDNPDETAEAVCFAALAELYAELGEMSAAEDAAERALRSGEPRSKARAYRTLAKLQRRAHSFADARHNLDQGLDYARQAEDKGEEIRILSELALVLGRQGDFDQALADARRAVELSHDMQRQRPLALLAHGAVHLYMASSTRSGDEFRKHLATAEEILARGYELAWAEDPEQTLWRGWIRHAQARVAIEAGDLGAGRKFADEAVDIFKDIRHRYGRAHGRMLLGVVNLRRGLPQEAVDELLSALETFRNCGDARAEADVSLLLAQAFLELDKPVQARSLQQAAVDRYLGLHDRVMAREAAVAVATTWLRRSGGERRANKSRRSAAARA